ncbi:MAG: hypothetical protein ABIS50_07875 [Luteolibacter sp.]|uniref:hypothetical protein n=1 Tax=Luteolibacter sp. TaxID=1962973 RepID=UPI0032653750
MIATLPPYKPHRALGLLPASVAIALVLSPVVIKLGMDQRERVARAGEYQSKRSLILSRIETAANRHDLETLTRLNEKYANCVSDGTFRSAIREAMAKVGAREAELELAVSRHLDLIRNQEELPLHSNPPKQQNSAEKPVEDQPLSKLPR